MKGATRYSQSLERGLAILASFTPEQPLMGITELAGALHLSRSTTHRYVRTLVTLGYLEQDISRKYRLGLDVTDLGLATMNAIGLPERAHPCMHDLARHAGHTVDLAVLDGSQTVLIHRVRLGRGERTPSGSARTGTSRGGAPPTSPLGTRQPAYCTSAGKALLAHLPMVQRSRLIAQIDFAKRTPKTIDNAQALDAELERVLEEGLAVADEELTAGACAIAAPVDDDSGDTIAAISIVAPVEEIGAERLSQEFGAALIAAAQCISERLGWRHRQPTYPAPSPQPTPPTKQSPDHHGAS